MRYKLFALLLLLSLTYAYDYYVYSFDGGLDKVVLVNVSAATTLCKDDFPNTTSGNATLQNITYFFANSNGSNIYFTNKNITAFAVGFIGESYLAIAMLGPSTQQAVISIYSIGTRVYIDSNTYNFLYHHPANTTVWGALTAKYGDAYRGIFDGYTFALSVHDFNSGLARAGTGYYKVFVFGVVDANYVDYTHVKVSNDCVDVSSAGLYVLMFYRNYTFVGDVNEGYTLPDGKQYVITGTTIPTVFINDTVNGTDYFGVVHNSVPLPTTIGGIYDEVFEQMRYNALSYKTNLLPPAKYVKFMKDGYYFITVNNTGVYFSTFTPMLKPTHFPNGTATGEPTDMRIDLCLLDENNTTIQCWNETITKIINGTIYKCGDTMTPINISHFNDVAEAYYYYDSGGYVNLVNVSFNSNSNAASAVYLINCIGTPLYNMGYALGFGENITYFFPPSPGVADETTGTFSPGLNPYTQNFVYGRNYVPNATTKDVFYGNTIQVEDIITTPYANDTVENGIINLGWVKAFEVANNTTQRKFYYDENTFNTIVIRNDTSMAANPLRININFNNTTGGTVSLPISYGGYFQNDLIYQRNATASSVQLELLPPQNISIRGGKAKLYYGITDVYYNPYVWLWFRPENRTIYIFSSYIKVSIPTKYDYMEFYYPSGLGYDMFIASTDDPTYDRIIYIPPTKVKVMWWNRDGTNGSFIAYPDCSFSPCVLKESQNGSSGGFYTTYNFSINATDYLVLCKLPETNESNGSCYFEMIYPENATANVVVVWKNLFSASDVCMREYINVSMVNDTCQYNVSESSFSPAVYVYLNGVLIYSAQKLSSWKEIQFFIAYVLFGFFILSAFFMSRSYPFTGLVYALILIVAIELLSQHGLPILSSYKTYLQLLLVIAGSITLIADLYKK